MSLKHTPTSLVGLREQREQETAATRKVAELEAANAELTGQITDLQLAIVELYESATGGTSASGAGGANNG
jgi:cell division protein FtsB